MTVQLNTTSGGSVSVEAEDTVSNVTVTVPANAGKLISTSGNPSTGDILQYDGGVWALTQIQDTDVKAALNATGAAPIYACRAWVNFDGTGAVDTNQSIRASGNVTSVVRTAVGVYTVTFTTPMPDGNYSICGVPTHVAVGGESLSLVGTPTATSFAFTTSRNAAAFNSSVTTVAVFR